MECSFAVRSLLKSRIYPRFHCKTSLACKHTQKSFVKSVHKWTKNPLKIQLIFQLLSFCMAKTRLYPNFFDRFRTEMFQSLRCEIRSDFCPQSLRRFVVFVLCPLPMSKIEGEREKRSGRRPRMTKRPICDVCRNATRKIYVDAFFRICSTTTSPCLHFRRAICRTLVKKIQSHLWNKFTAINEFFAQFYLKECDH